MKLQEILRTKGTLVHRIGPQETLSEVVRRLFELRIGSLVVCEPPLDDESPMLGIITERDVLRALALGSATLDRLRVGDYMTADLATGSPLDEVPRVMGLMTERRIRHLPVVHEGTLIGIISIGDVVKAQHDEMVMENHLLKSYLNGGITSDAV